MTAIYEEQPENFSPTMYAPFAERKENTVQFQLTTGCSHAKCTFCSMYKEPNTQKTLREGKKHVDAVLKKIPCERKRGLEKIFIGSGDCMGMDTLTLMKLTQYTIKKFREEVGRLPRRLSLFASTRNLKSQNFEGLNVLNCGGSCRSYFDLPNSCSKDIFGEKRGINLIYWGIESGSDAVLKELGKGCTSRDILEADGHLPSDLKKSVTVMPGAGGLLHADNHLEKTAEVLNEIHPKFITFIGFDPAPNTAYAKKMAREFQRGVNRPLTQREMATQTLEMVRRLKFSSTIGCFETSQQTFGKNPFPFGSQKRDYWEWEGFVWDQEEKLAHEHFEDDCRYKDWDGIKPFTVPEVKSKTKQDIPDKYLSTKVRRTVAPIREVTEPSRVLERKINYYLGGLKKLNPLDYSYDLYRTETPDYFKDYFKKIGTSYIKKN